LGVAMLIMAACGEVYVHDDFTKIVSNKSEQEIIDTIGKPTTVEANNPKHVTWTYYAKTVDINNQNKRDAKTLLIFEPEPSSSKLRVVGVKFERG